MEKIFGNLGEPITSEEGAHTRAPCITAHGEGRDAVRDGREGESVVDGVGDDGYCEMRADTIAHTPLRRANVLLKKKERSVVVCM